MDNNIDQHIYIYVVYICKQRPPSSLFHSKDIDFRKMGKQKELTERRAAIKDFNKKQNGLGSKMNRAQRIRQKCLDDRVIESRISRQLPPGTNITPGMVSDYDLVRQIDQLRAQLPTHKQLKQTFYALNAPPRQTPRRDHQKHGNTALSKWLHNERCSSLNDELHRFAEYVQVLYFFM